MRNILVAMSIAVLCSCGGGTFPAKQAPDVAPDVQDAFLETVAVPDAYVPVDAVEAVDPGAFDADVIAPPACDTTPLDPGCPCTQADECQSSYCIQSSAGRVCAQACTGSGECASGQVCAQVSTYPDVVFVCIDPYPSLCRPCEADLDCRVDFALVQPRCLPLGEAGFGSFCVAPCSAESGTESCIEGYACKTSPDVREGGSYCLPDSGACECTPLAVSVGARTDCLRTNAIGSCPGKRMCGAGGLSDCVGADAVVETCNGLDDDCDGSADEGIAPVACTQPANEFGACPGTTACAAGKTECAGTPALEEACNGVDDDCDGSTDEGFADLDDDGIADCRDCDLDGDGVMNPNPDCPLADPWDNCTYVQNPDQLDRDFDNLGDACDPDIDGDGVPNEVDNCPLVPNPEVGDLDLDGIGDACDCDQDGDGVENQNPLCGVCAPCDNCPGTPNPAQEDLDANGIGDACEDDWDGDGVGNAVDNCPRAPNAKQEDLDGDKAGDVCDCDIDGDGVANANPGCPAADPADNCPRFANEDQANLDGDSEGDACDSDEDGDGDPNATDCAPRDPDVHHGLQETCNGVDDDCDGATDEGAAAGCTLFYKDGDGDGAGVTGAAACLCAPDAKYGASVAGDCDDTRPEVHPGAVEACDGLDDDCDGQVDEADATGCTPYYYDGDGDGHGTAGAPKCLCAAAAPWSATAGDDCNDADGSAYPGAVEACDGGDDDCDGLTDEEDASGCQVWHTDLDKDGYGSDADSKCLCAKKAPYLSPVGGDCDDLITTVHPGAVEKCNGLDDNCDGDTDEGSALGCSVFYRDADGDGAGRPGDQVCRCAAEGEYAAPAPDDCDDADADVHPGAAEACNGADDDCDGQTDEGAAAGCTAWHLDADGDGYGQASATRCQCGPQAPYTTTDGTDCNDADSTSNPGATEKCDGADNDCDGSTDEAGAAGCAQWRKDADGDGYGGDGDTKCLCAKAAPYTTLVGGDCDDAAASVHPGAGESCNAIDDDCDGSADEGAASGCTVHYRDADKDGSGKAGDSICRCGPEGLYTATSPGDCNDDASAVHPGAIEACNGVDDDCDAATDEGAATGCKTFFYDGDGDGFGLAGSSQCACKAVAPYTAAAGTDCNDADGGAFPGATEKCDGVDNDCDGVTDEVGAVGCATWYADADGDGYGDVADWRCLCAKAAPWLTLVGGDCNDASASIRPGVQEACNGVDDDCDGAADEGAAVGCKVWYRDADGDGFGRAGDSQCRCGPQGEYTAAGSGDCDDAALLVFPGAPEACNGIDDDCDAATDEGAATGCTMFYLDADLDGYGPTASGTCLCAAVAPYKVSRGGDCDDTKTFVNPGVVEACDGVDNDCDGSVDEEGAIGCRTRWSDADGDGWGALGSSRCLCGAAGTWTAWTGGDCDDASATVFPGAANVCTTAAQCCAPADTCLDGRCAIGGGSATCTTDAGCPSDYHCVSGTCEPWGTGADEACNRATVAGIFRPALQCKWSGPPATDPYPTSNNVIPTPMVADFDLDGDPSTIRPSIVFASNAGTACDNPNDLSNGRIRVIDGAGCANQYTITAYEVPGASPVAIGDLDRAADKRPEIVANAAGGGLVAFKFNAAANRFDLLWHSREANGSDSTWAGTLYRWTGPTIADVTGDGVPEVAMGTILHDATGLVIASNLGYRHLNGTGQIAVLADVDNDAQAEMVTGDGVWRYAAGTGWVKETYFTATVSDGFVALADFGAYAVSGLGTAGLPEVVVIAAGTARIQTLSGQIVFGPFDIPFFAPATDKGAGGAPTVGDFDGDGRPEFAMAGKGSYTIFDLDCNAVPTPYGCYARGILWSQPTQDYSSSMSGSSVFDFEGDGKAEAVYSDECFVRVYSGNTGEVLFSQARTSGTWYEGPVLADVDGDFRTELVAGTNRNCGVSCPAMDPYFRGLRCTTDEECPSGATGACKTGYCRCTVDADCGAGTGFACADPIANTPGTGKVCRTKHPGSQAGLFVFRDTGDNWVASRPIWNQHAYSVTNVNDDGSIPASGGQRNWQVAGLNNFRQNVQGSLQPTLAPDLTARLGVIGNCDGDGKLAVPGIVCNRGAAPVARGIPVAFTLGTDVACLKTTTMDLYPGDCETLSCTYTPGTASLTIGVWADYGGTKGDATECREDNNATTRAGVTCTNL